MSYHRGNLPPEFVPPPRVEPLTSDRFMELLDDYIYAAADDGSATKERAALAAAVEELFRRLAT